MNRTTLMVLLPCGGLDPLPPSHQPRLRQYIAYL